jgi:hypothetical protein
MNTLLLFLALIAVIIILYLRKLSKVVNDPDTGQIDEDVLADEAGVSPGSVI